MVLNETMAQENLKIFNFSPKYLNFASKKRNYGH